MLHNMNKTYNREDENAKGYTGSKGCGSGVLTLIACWSSSGGCYSVQILTIARLGKSAEECASQGPQPFMAAAN